MASDSGNEPDFPFDLGSQQVPPNLGSMAKWVAIIGALVVIFAVLSFARSVYTDFLWFDQLGFSGVFIKIVTTRIALFAIGSLFFGTLLGVSAFFAYRASAGESNLPVPPEALVFLERLVKWGSVAVVIVLSVIFGGILSAKWEIFLRFANSVPFNTADPLFNKDISFYVFTLPMYDFIQGWLLGTTVLVLLATVGMYFVRYSLRGLQFEMTTELKIHVSILAALVMIAIAGGHWLDRWGLVLSTQGAVFGAAYADVHARLPALLVSTIIALGSAILMLVNAYTAGFRLLIGSVILWIAATILLGTAWPALMQQFTVTPNEFVREAPFLSRSLDFTRKGFNLDNVREEFFPANPKVSSDHIEENLQTVRNVRLWDYRPLSSVYRQIQLIRSYYDFKDADVDRYTIDGEVRQVLLSAREVAPEKLDIDRQTWTNRKLVYTHGIGVAMSPVTEFTEEGLPEFFAKDIPSDGVIPVSFEDSEPDILVENPRIYYGENTHDYVIVNTKADELDYQTTGGELFRTNYFGDGGVRLGSILQRVAYAWQFGDINVLISGEITGDSRIQYRREIQERIRTVAPFLLLDQDPYIVATNNEFFWVQDAYTVSDHYPYSDPISPGSFNYIRNSVKATVDAFNGTVKFHIWDTSDPVIMTYAKIFPSLFSSQAELPESMREHIRYPQDLFSIQAEKYVRFHMKDPQNFYNDEDLWAIPNEKFGQTENLRVVEPYYIIMKLPGEEEEEFVQLLPYTPNQRQNLVGWLAARNDVENYGQLVAFNFPKDRQVDGPEQVEARIDNDQDISAWFTLRCSEGSNCIRGNLLVIPIGDSLLYAEPVYIQAEGVEFPQLKRVILASGEKVVMEDTLEEALIALTGSSSIEGLARPSQSAPTAPVEASEPSTLQKQINNADALIESIREDLSSLENALEQLKELAGGE